MSEVQSKTQQLIYRNSYRKHKERLNDIRHNITAKDYHLPPKRPTDKKGDLRNKSKQEEIIHENGLLRDKIHHIKQRQMPDPTFLSHTENLKVPVRYDSDIKIDSMEMEDGQTVRCVIPAHKYRANQPPRPQLTSYYSQKQPNSLRKKRPLSFHRTDRAQRTHSQQAARQQQLFYHLPERNEQRQVINRKTVILSPTQSCLFQLSLIGDRLLIAAHIMGLESYCLTELLSSRLSTQLLKQYENNYEQFYPKITLQQSNKRYKAIKIHLKQPQVERKVSQEEMNQYKMKTQQNFIQRNYYGKIKKEQVGKEGKEDKDRPTITHDRLQELMERLAVPAKRYSIRGGAPAIGRQENGAKPSNQLPHASSHQSKPIVISKVSVHIDSKETEDRRRNNMKKTSDISIMGTVKQSSQFTAKPREEKPKERQMIKLQQTESEQFEPQKPSDAETFLNSNMRLELNAHEDHQKKKTQKGKVQEQQDVQYLDGSNDYQQSFQELPQYSLKNKLESKKGNPNKNESIPIANIEEEQYQNQEYEAMLESDVHPITPKPEAPAPVKHQVKEQYQQYDEYAEQFQN